MKDSPLIFLVAGEASGDVLGGRLMLALRAATGGNIRFDGVGGAEMIAAGLESRFPMQELSLMGVGEVLLHVPRLWRRMRELSALVREMRPAALVTIDAPAFNLRLSRRLAGLGIPRVHYVAPQVWAWRPGRARKLANALDHLMTLLPFEPACFTPYGCDARFVGHPAIETAVAGDGAGFRARYGIDGKARLLLLLPGSRAGEISRLAPVFGETLRALRARYPDLVVVVPSLPEVAGLVRHHVARWNLEGGAGRPVLVTSGATDRYAAFATAGLALAASGTVSLELALCGCPVVVAYRMNPLSAGLARRLLRVKWVSLANILLEGPVIPEFLQDGCNAGNLAKALGGFLEDPAAGARQRASFARLAGMLGSGGPSPAARAAQRVLEAAGEAARPKTAP